MDFNLNSESPFCTNDIDLILQQIDIMFDTVPGDVIGFENYGTQYDEYMHVLHISKEGLKNEVLSNINSLNLFGFTPEVEIYLLQGTEQDITLIEITLIRNNEIYKKTYNIS